MILPIPSNKVITNGIINSKKLYCLSHHLSQSSKSKKIISLICTNFYKACSQLAGQFPKLLFKIPVR